MRPPGSKSLTNRELIIAALAAGETTLVGGLHSDDTRVMIDALRMIGIRIDAPEDKDRWKIDPVGRAAPSHEIPTKIEVGNSGTTIRFLTAALTAVGGHYRLVGVDRMHQRPIGDLVEALMPVIKGNVITESPRGCPPVRIRSKGWTDKPIRVAGIVSSQYLSGLMMAAGMSDRPKRIDYTGELVSLPYVEMTATVMAAAGARVDPMENGWTVCGPYRGGCREIEPDASAATYAMAAAAMTGTRVRIRGLRRDALQGDVGFADVLTRLGCEVRFDDDGIVVDGPDAYPGIDVDMNAISDTVQSLAPVALFARSPTRIRGVAHNRFKETDRIGDLARELRRVGAEVTEHEDGMTIHPIADVDTSDAGQTPPVRLRTYDDHRMAMGLSLIGLRRPNTFVKDPACTAKTYPNFWFDLERIIGRPLRWA